MAMYRLKCSSCGWATLPHYEAWKCRRDKESDHLEMGHMITGVFGRPDAHDSAFTDICPKCGKARVKEEYRYFPSDEIERLERARYSAFYALFDH